MTKALYLFLLCVATVVASEVCYIIRPSQSQSCGYQFSSSACVDNESDLTLSQFVNSSSDYLTNNTRLSLIFLPGNYCLESELIIENVNSFSMFAWPSASSKTVITCCHNARFEFRNVGMVTVSGLEFAGCFENHVSSIGQFQFENTGFSRNDQVTVKATAALIIEESVANLDRVAFISAVENIHEVPENYTASIIETTNVVLNFGILSKRSNITITQSWFKENRVGLGAVIYDEFGSDIVISNTTFANNVAAQYQCNNHYCFTSGIVLVSKNSSILKLYYSKFEHNVGIAIFSHGVDMYTSAVSIIHSQFVGNTMIGPRTFSGPAGLESNSLIAFVGVTAFARLNEFINNTASFAIVYIRYNTPEDLTNNVFTDSIASYEVFFSSRCQPDHGLSLGSSRCIKCSENRHQYLIVIVVVAFIAGIALVIFMLALNMTVAVGTLNGILFYVNIVAVNAESYFLPFKTPDFVTVFISWLNLEVGFDVCFDAVEDKTLDVTQTYKALIHLTFPAYIIILVIIVVVTSERSSKFAKIIGKGNAIAVLATMILLSYTKFFDVILTSFSLLYFQPAYGSRNLDVRRFKLGNASTIRVVGQGGNSNVKAPTIFLFLVSILIFAFSVIFTVVIFSWQWLLRYQDKVIFKWVKYQKLRHFLDPYHAPYTAKYRFWTGLLLLVRVFLHLISALNFSLDPRVDLMAVVFFVGGLILLKGVTAKRVYKNWPLDVMETAIYFNLVAFSALTWYNLDFGGNQVAVAYTSVMIIFVLLLGVTVFHILRYTRLYKLSYVAKALKWTSKLLENKQIEQAPNDGPEELDGYQLERSAAEDQELPTITFSVVDINQPIQNQEEIYTE